MKVSRYLGLLLLLIAVSAQAADPLPESYLCPAPKLPGFMAETVTIDAARLSRMAETYRSAKGAVATPEDFLFAYLPGRIFNRILHGTLDTSGLAADNGLLYLSGFEGGVWLNHIMAGQKETGIGFPKLLSIRLPVLALLDRYCSKRMRIVDRGSVAKKRRALEGSFDRLVMSYGYNRGYLLEILKHPPQGAVLAESYVTCNGLLGCCYPMPELAALDPLMDTREMIENPTTKSWEQLSERLNSRLPSTIERGRKVWQGITSEQSFSPEAYKALIDISAEFLMINEAVLLMSARALAEGNEADMDRALMADAALNVWLGAYMIGLSQKEKDIEK